MPTYNEMVTEAILALKERNGSSVQAIKKHIISGHPDLTFAPHQLRSALKKGTEAGKYIKVKNSFKLSPEAKKPLPKKIVKVVKKPEPKKASKSDTKKKLAPRKASGGAAPKKSTRAAAPKKAVAKKKTVTKPAASKKAPVKKAPVRKATAKKATPKKAAGKKAKA